MPNKDVSESTYDIKISERAWVILSRRNIIVYIGTSFSETIKQEILYTEGYRLAQVDLKLTISEENFINQYEISPDSGVRYDP